MAIQKTATKSRKSLFQPKPKQALTDLLVLAKVCLHSFYTVLTLLCSKQSI
jgi:hypothetical protein